MAKFRKKSVVVDAEQFLGSSLTPGVHPPMRGDRDGSFYVITTHGQQTFIEFGDWIIKEPDGRGYYPCKPDIFEATYEPVKEERIRGLSANNIIFDEVSEWPPDCEWVKSHFAPISKGSGI